jgi:hypothetical protein
VPSRREPGADLHAHGVERTRLAQADQHDAAGFHAGRRQHRQDVVRLALETAGSERALDGALGLLSSCAAVGVSLRSSDADDDGAARWQFDFRE